MAVMPDSISRTKLLSPARRALRWQFAGLVYKGCNC